MSQVTRTKKKDLTRPRRAPGFKMRQINPMTQIRKFPNISRIFNTFNENLKNQEKSEKTKKLKNHHPQPQTKKARPPPRNL